IDNNIMLLYNYGHEDLITHRAKAICGVSADRKNTGCVAVLSFAEPAPAQDFRQSPTSSVDNFLQKQQKQWGGLWCRGRRDALPARRDRWPAAWLANSTGAPVAPSVVAHEAGRPMPSWRRRRNDLLLTGEILLQICCRWRHH